MTSDTVPSDQSVNSAICQQCMSQGYNIKLLESSVAKKKITEVSRQHNPTHVDRMASSLADYV